MSLASGSQTGTANNQNAILFGTHLVGNGSAGPPPPRWGRAGVGVHTGGIEITGVPPIPTFPRQEGRGPGPVRQSRAERC
jgi:hypothetical protein